MTQVKKRGRQYPALLLSSGFIADLGKVTPEILLSAGLLTFKVQHYVPDFGKKPGLICHVGDEIIFDFV